MNYYEILGVGRDVSEKDLKKAYKKLAKKWHPDLNRDNLKVAEEKMREINVAYETLSDSVKRMDYDKKLDNVASGQGQSQTRSKTQQTRRQTQKTATQTSGKVDFENLNRNFASFFGFDPKTHKITNEDKLNTYTEERQRKKNPLDTTDMFERFMGFKK